ncbi:MAG: hypothetical protein AAGD10_08405 [Myxococcota bacterium]
MGVELRLATGADVPEMARLCRENAAKGGEPFHSFPALAPPLFLEPYLELQPTHCWVAVGERGLVGYAVGAADTRRHRRLERRLLLRRLPHLLSSLRPTSIPSRGALRSLAHWARRLSMGGMRDPTVERYIDLGRFPAHAHLQVRKELAPPTTGLGLMVKLQKSFVEAGARGQHGLAAEPEDQRRYWRMMQALGARPVHQWERLTDEGTNIISVAFEMQLRKS